VRNDGNKRAVLVSQRPADYQGGTGFSRHAEIDQPDLTAAGDVGPNGVRPRTSAAGPYKQSNRAAEAASPDAANTVGFKDPLVGGDGEVFCLGLGDQHAVKGVFVRSGEEAGANAVVDGNIQGRKPFPAYETLEVRGQFLGSRQASESYFRGDFPCRGRAHQNHIRGGRHGLARGGREGRIITKPPE